MRHLSLVLFSALLSGLPLSIFAAPTSPSVPADSFIAQHVATPGQLHQQISLDPVVRRRLARHFHTSAPAVTRYIQDNLVLTRLKTAHRYRVYCVSRTGREYIVNQRMAAGTPVFVLRSTGQPVLKLACGNPMVAALPAVATKVAAYRSPKLSPDPALVSAKPAPALETHTPVLVALNNAPGVVVMPTTKVAGFIGQLPVVRGGGGNPLGFLAAIPVIAAVTGSRGGNNGTPGTDTMGTGTGQTTGTGTNGNTTGTTGTTGTDTLGTTGTGTNGNNTNGNTSGTTGSETGTNNGTDTLGTTGGTNTGDTGVTPVPEPGTPVAFAVGGLVLAFLLTASARRRKASQRG